MQFDPWGRVVGRKAWTIGYSGSPSSASATFEQSQQYVYDAAGLLIRLHHDAAAANGDFQTRFVTDPFGRVLEEAGYSKADSDGSLTLAERKRYVWSPVTGDLIYYEADTDQPLDGVYGLRHFTAVDAEGNTVGLFNAATGSVHSRLWYTPSGEMATVSAVSGHAAGSAGALSELIKQTRFQYLFGQGRYLGFGYVDLATGLGHGGVTQLAGGLQYDALQNGVVKVIGSAFWDDVNDTAPKPVEYTWWDRYGSPITDAWSTGVGYVTGGINWVADRLDDAGGWLINHHLYTLVPTTALASGLTRFAGGIVGLADVPGLITGTMVAYGAYREEGLTVFESAFYASPVIGGIGQVGSQLVTGQSYAAHDFGRSLSWTERITNAAFALSIGAGGVARLGAVRAGGAAATPASTTPRSVPLKVLNGTERLAAPKGTINPRLVQRMEAYRTYKAGGGKLDLRGWVKQTQGNSKYGTGFKSGYAAWAKRLRSTHGNSSLSQRNAYLYRLETKAGEFLKWGITQNLATRYTQGFMANKRIFPQAFGPRSEMLRMERHLVETRPGLLNLEPWAGAKL